MSYRVGAVIGTVELALVDRALSLSAAGNAHGTAAIDMSVDQVLTLTGQLANVADTMVLEGFIIDIFPG